MHVELSDFSHIYDLKNKRTALQHFQKMGERRVVGSAFLPQGKSSIVQKKYRFNKGKTCSIIPKYALYLPFMHC